jgi:hypothetical protein
LFVFISPFFFISQKKSASDPAHMRKLVMAICVTLFTFISLPVGKAKTEKKNLTLKILNVINLKLGWGVYFAMGRNPNAYTARVGVFDWMIGHQCQGTHFIHRNYLKRKESKKQSINK